MNPYNLFDGTEDEKSLETYSDRFNPVYLRKLLTALQPENLIKTRHFERTKLDGQTRTKECIEINFCGNAANALFGRKSFGRAALSDESKLLLIEINDAFIKLFDNKTLKYFDGQGKNGTYLKVRICLGYPYSDFPVCLMKAEDPTNWDHVSNPLYNFHTNKRLEEIEMEGSAISESQKHTLEAIATLIRNNNRLLDRLPETHSIQIRFSVIPSPLCLLIINNKAYCDSYLYAITKNNYKDKRKEFSLRYPVSIIRNDETSDKQFESVQMHFDYLWKHDLTLFCEDGTFFNREEGNYEMLAKIRNPCDVKWTDKKKRIMSDYEAAKHPLHKDHIFFNKNQFEIWIKNVEMKFPLSTDKIKLVQPCKEENLKEAEVLSLRNLVEKMKADIVDENINRDIKAWKRKPYYYIITGLIIGFIVTLTSYHLIYKVQDSKKFVEWIESNSFATEFTIKGLVEILFKFMGVLVPTFLFILNFLKKFYKRAEQDKKRDELKTKYEKQVNEKYNKITFPIEKKEVNEIPVSIKLSD